MERSDVLNQMRYAERLCQRTARLYHRLQTFSTFMTVFSGSAAVLALVAALPQWTVGAGVALVAAFGASLVAIRPKDKALANEADALKYAELRTRADGMLDADLEPALAKARESDVAEIEPLRDVAWNDVVVEIGRPEVRVALRPTQRLLAVLA